MPIEVPHFVVTHWVVWRKDSMRGSALFRRQGSISPAMIQPQDEREVRWLAVEIDGAYYKLYLEPTINFRVFTDKEKAMVAATVMKLKGDWADD